MGIKKNFFAPLASGLGATRRAAVLLLVMMLTAMTAWAQGLSGSGTSESPYVINTTSDWETFAANINAGTGNSDYYQLGHSITVTTMAGTSAHPFSGHFDGNGKTLTFNYTTTQQYAAPFRYVSGAEFHDLNLAGSITTSAQYAASLAAECTGETTVRRCTSTATITSTYSGTATNGGFIALVDESSTVVAFTECVFRGSLLGDDGVRGNGGFVGWNSEAPTYTDCIFAPVSVTMDATGSGTFDAKGNGVFTRCYSTMTFGREQGIKAYATAASVPAGNLYKAVTVGGTTVYPVVTATLATTVYATGSDHQAVPAVTIGSDALTVGTDYTLDYSAADDSSEGIYTVTVTGTGNYYGSNTVTYYVTNNSETLDGHSFAILNGEYLITSTDDLDALAAYVNADNSCYGKTFRLTQDLDYTGKTYTPIGNSSCNFSGHFDGSNHTISGIRITNGGDYQALFGKTYNSGSVKNVILADAQISGSNMAGGIVGRNGNSFTIENCHVLADVILTGSDAASSKVGGIASDNQGEIKDCSSAATLSGTGQYFGGIAGSNYSGHSLTGNLAVGINFTATINAYPSYKGAIAGYNGGTLSGNYYSGGNIIGGYNGSRDSNGTDTDGQAQPLSDGYIVTVGDGVTADGSKYFALAPYYKYAAGATVTLGNTATAPTNYTLGYTVNGTPISGNTFTMPDGNVTVSLALIPIAYAITYNGVDGATFETANPTTYTIESAAITLNNPSKTGYEFAGWYDNSEFTGDAIATIATGSSGNKTFWAKWTRPITSEGITISIPSQEWTSSALTPVITVKDGETTLSETTDYTVTAPSGTIQDSGNHAYTITGMGNYSGSRVAMFTITPYLADQAGAVYVYQDQNGKTALLDGTSVDPVDIDFNNNIIVNHVTSNRVFTPGMASTVMLPFNYTCNGEEGGTFYKFVGVKKENDKWVATMQETGNDANNKGTLEANTPYLFMPAATTMTFPNINGSVRLFTRGSGSGGNCETADPGSHWTFKGTYKYMHWKNDPDDLYYYDRSQEIGHVYGFAGVEKDDINVGDFVKVAWGAKIRPMRAYLLWSDTPNAAPARRMTRGASVDELPSRITVRLVSSNGETTGIGELDTATGEISMDGWWTLDGVRLSGKPTKKGLYINNGKKIVIK